jgi:hypothetical protein
MTIVVVVVLEGVTVFYACLSIPEAKYEGEGQS